MQPGRGQAGAGRRTQSPRAPAQGGGGRRAGEWGAGKTGPPGPPSAGVPEPRRKLCGVCTVTCRGGARDSAPGRPREFGRCAAAAPGLAAPGLGTGALRAAGSPTPAEPGAGPWAGAQGFRRSGAPGSASVGGAGAPAGPGALGGATPTGWRPGRSQRLARRRRPGGADRKSPSRPRSPLSLGPPPRVGRPRRRGGPGPPECPRAAPSRRTERGGAPERSRRLPLDGGTASTRQPGPPSPLLEAAGPGVGPPGAATPPAQGPSSGRACSSRPHGSWDASS